MKKLIALLMALCLLLSAGAALADVTYPIKTDKPVKLKVWMEMNAGASQVFTNYMENPVYQRFSEVTGIELEMMHPTYGAAGEGFGMMLAGSELPDIIVDLEKFYNGGAVAAYDDELIYDLTPYLEENAPDYYKLINVNDDVRRQFYNEDGKVLGFYYYEDEYDSLADCLVVRPDWCEEFGIDPAQITTFDKLEEYLQKVKDTKPGVTPFLTSKDKTFTTLGAGYNVYQGFYQEDGTVKYYADSQEWHDFLGFSLQGYRTMLQNPNVGIGYANTIFYVVVGTVLSIFFSCLGAYTLSRPKLMFKKLFTLLVVFTMYFSGGMIPKFLVVKGVGLYNTRMAVILPGVISTWNMIVMRTSFRAIPQSLEESARLDGAGDFTILFRIIVPCAKATIAVMVLYYAVAQWNGWFDAMIYLQDRSKFPLQLFLREILLININNANNAAGNDAADVLYLDTLVKYAMIIISTVPILCIYPFVQKYFMKGVMMGSIKE